MSNSDDVRWRQRLESFLSALEHLEEACNHDEYSGLERAGLIKTFEFCFELSWKVLKDLLFYEGHRDTSPRAVIRRSFEAGYLDEQDCEVLLVALEKRNVLSHAYREEAALEAEDLIKNQYYSALMRLEMTLKERSRR